MKNEMRVAYLTEEFARLNETHVHDVKATYNKNELKMRQYAIQCVNEAYEELKGEWHAVFLQLENLKEHEEALSKENMNLYREVRRQERCIIELRAWAKGDEL